MDQQTYSDELNPRNQIAFRALGRRFGVDALAWI